MDGQFFFVRGERKALTFSLNLTRFIRTPVNANNGLLTLAHRTDCFAVYFEGEKAFGWSLQHVDLPERNSHRIWMNCFLLVIGQRFLSVSVDLVVGMTSL